MGFEFGKDKNLQTNTKTFASNIVDNDDINVVKYGGGDVSRTSIPVFNYDNDIDKIKVYRNIANTTYVNLAVLEIKNESFIFNTPNKKAFHIDFYDDGAELSDKIKDAINEEVNNLYNTINFEDNGNNWFERFYVDSKFAAHVVIDEKKKRNGILGVIVLDPVKVRKVKFIPNPDENGIINVDEVDEAYMYTDGYNNGDLSQAIYLPMTKQLEPTMMTKESVIMINSGLKDMNTGKTIGHLDKAVVPYNSLKMMEESMVIFRVARAPMRRAIYIDTSHLQPSKGEAYIKEMKNRFKIKVAYDSKTGTITGGRHTQSMLEDYWLPRQNSGKSTEIQTLEGQSDQSILDEVDFFKNQLWLSLNVPQSRFQEQAVFNFGRSAEIQRDEWRFNKFLNSVRNRFMMFFDELLKRQLILKGIIKEYEWEYIKSSYFWKYTEDNLFATYKNSEKLNTMVDLLDRYTPHIGDVVSKQWIYENVCEFTEEEIKEIKAQIAKEPKPIEDENG